MNKTPIEWVKNQDGSQGITLNSKTGCLNHTPEGLCLGGMFPCYAYRLAQGRLKQRYLANSNVADITNRLRDANSPLWDRVAFDPFYPRWWPERLEQIKKIKKPTGIFLDDMSDWMGDYWPEEWTEQELQVMRDCPQHRFYTLTKQPQNLIKWSPFPENAWVGVTATGDQQMFNKAMFGLSRVESKIKFLSFEPLLEHQTMHSSWLTLLGRPLIQWVIIGAQTKPAVYPKIEWVEEIVRATDQAGVKVFLKDNLEPLLNDLSIVGSSFGRLTELKSLEPKDGPRQRDWYQLRQEMPG